MQDVRLRGKNSYVKDNKMASVHLKVADFSDVDGEVLIAKFDQPVVFHKTVWARESYNGPVTYRPYYFRVYDSKTNALLLNQFVFYPYYTDYMQYYWSRHFRQPVEVRLFRSGLDFGDWTGDFMFHFSLFRNANEDYVGRVD